MYYKIENNYPVISPIPLEGFVEYTVGNEPQELKDAFVVQKQQELAVNTKQAKQVLLDSITVTTTSGKVFDGRDKDQSRMAHAIMSASAVGITETQWKLADNSVAIVTLDELKEALALGIQRVGEIVIGV